MNYLLILLLIGSWTATIGRPFEMEEGNDSDSEEAEYESDGGVAADESLGNDGESRNDKELTHLEDDASKNRDFTDMNEGSNMQRSVADENSNGKFSDYKIPSKDTHNDEFYDSNNSNDELQAPTKSLQSNRISERSDPDENNYKPNRKQNNVISDNEDKIMIGSHMSNEEGNQLFRDNSQQISKIAKTDYNNNEASDASESQNFKQYYNTMQAENNGINYDKNHENTRLNLNRDRRQVLSKNIEPINLSNAQNGKTLEKSTSEDEEAAIKSHIKKLSSGELEDLLNSLSEEKRALLKRIIDNDVESVEDGSDNISKREIIKKALEENNFIENAQSESIKMQGSSPLYGLNTESSITHNSDTTEITKQSDIQTENNDITTTKTAESNDSLNAELRSSDDSKVEKPDNSLNTKVDDNNAAEYISNNKVTIKNENKRETNLDDLVDINLSVDDSKSDFNTNDLQNPSDQGCFCSGDEDMSQLIDEEAQLHGNTGNTYKRQVDMSDLSDSVRKNLEDSFPNSDAYDETGPYSYSGPLIRVKRTNPAQAMKKRAAALLPNAKVAYVPYRSENDDEDNDEGNEFDDDTFYDKTSHFAKGNIKAIEEDSGPDKLMLNSKQSKINDIKANVGNYCKLSKSDNLESDTMSLGSDTDSVISGVEGVDDNLMYSSGVRKRRNADGLQMEDVKPIHPSLSTSPADDHMKGVSSNAMIAPNYQESDPFGPLSRTYEGDLGRYKRIRRVKQTHITDETASSD